MRVQLLKPRGVSEQPLPDDTETPDDQQGHNRDDDRSHRNRDGKRQQRRDLLLQGALKRPDQGDDEDRKGDRGQDIGRAK